MFDDPLEPLRHFVRLQIAAEAKREYQESHLAGYVLNLSYDTATIATCSSFRRNIGGIGRGDFLLMVLQRNEEDSQYVLLRVLDSAETPLTQDLERTIFELHRNGLPNTDSFTESQLQWGGLETQVLGAFEIVGRYDEQELVFVGDLSDTQAAHHYVVYKPDADMVHLIINHFVTRRGKFQIGLYRPRESRTKKGVEQVRVMMSAYDLLDSRTALFGKTRLGKSNVVKLLSESVMTSLPDIEGLPRIAHIIFDANGEYSNDNPQDGDVSLASKYPNRCIIYALTPKRGTASKSLRLNFYLYPSDSLRIVRALFGNSKLAQSSYIKSFLAADVPDPADLAEMDHAVRKRAKRKILILWAILHKAGFEVEEKVLRDVIGSFDPRFAKNVREKAGLDTSVKVKSLDDLATELEVIADLTHQETLRSSSGKPLFDADDLALLGFLRPKSSIAAGTAMLRPLQLYHEGVADNFVEEIVASIALGKTIILDLSNAPRPVARYFSEYLSNAIFEHQTTQFTENWSVKHHVMLVFEEAHNLFPRDGKEMTIYHRTAKEGAKYQIGIIYSTQSPTSIDRELLSQTENFFVVHLSARADVNALAQVNVAFEPIRETLLSVRAVGHVHMLTRSHRFTIPMQARKFGEMELEVTDYAIPF